MPLLPEEQRRLDELRLKQLKAKAAGASVSPEMGQAQAMTGDNALKSRLQAAAPTGNNRQDTAADSYEPGPVDPTVRRRATGEAIKLAAMNMIPAGRVLGAVGLGAKVARLGSLGKIAATAGEQAAVGAGATELGSLVGEGKLADGGDVATNAALMGATVPAAAAAARVMGAITNRATSPLSTPARTASAEKMREAGYIIPEGGGFIDKTLKGIAGKDAIKQAASIKNNAVTDSLAREANRMGPTDELTTPAMQAIRKEAYRTGYEPVAKAGIIKVDGQYATEITDIVKNYQEAAKSFPGAVSDNIMEAMRPLAVPEFDAGHGLKMIQLLRDNADDAFRAGNSALGRANKQAAKSLEDQIERGLVTMGQPGRPLLAAFRDARQSMAVAHTTEEAIREGGNSVIPSKLGQRFQAGKPMSGGLETAGEMANNFPAYSQEASRVAMPGVSKVQAGLSLLAGSGVGASTGSVPMAIAAAAAPYSSDIARALVLSKPYQKIASTKGVATPEAMARIQAAIRAAASSRNR